MGGVEQGVEITAGQAILSGQEQKDDPARRITRDAPRCPVKLIRELLFNGEQWDRGGGGWFSKRATLEIFDAI